MPEYIVSKGDTLSGIAQKVGLGGNWKALGYTGDPTKLQVGTKLSWGSPSTPGTAAPVTPAFTPQQEYDKAASGFSSGYNDIMNRQNTEMSNLVGGQEKLTDAYTRLSTEAGIPELTKQLQFYKDQIYGIQNTLNNLEGNVNERTKGTLTNESQRQRQITAESNPLQKNLAALGIASAPIQERITGASAGVQNMLGLLRADQDKAISTLSDKFAREITGYTTTKQVELDNLLNKVQRQQQLDDREWERVQTLAAEERAWAREKQKISMEQGTSIAEQLKSLGLGQTSTSSVDQQRTSLIKNKLSSGQWIKDTENVAQGLSIVDTIDGQANPFKGMSKDQILGLIYPLRKPYESTPNKGAYISPTALFGMKG